MTLALPLWKTLLKLQFTIETLKNIYIYIYIYIFSLIEYDREKGYKIFFNIHFLFSGVETSLLTHKKIKTTKKEKK
jgi:hypothetical protein